MMRRRQQPEPEDAEKLLPPLAAAPPGEEAGGPALARLNMLAYNFFQLPWFAMPFTHKRARIDEFCDGPAARYDVCCLTEVWRDPVRNNRRYLAERAARIGGAYQFLSLNRLFVYETQFRKKFSQDFIATFFH